MNINNKELKIIYQMISDLFCIGETLVTESKREISSEEAIERIRDYSLRSSNMQGITEFYMKVYRKTKDLKK